MFLSHKNVRGGPASTIMGALIVAAAIGHWFKTGQWTEGHSAVFVAGAGMAFAPDRLKPKDPPQ